MNKTENKKDEFDLALENMKLEPEADLEEMYRRLIASMKYSMENGESCGTRG